MTSEIVNRFVLSLVQRCIENHFHFSKDVDTETQNEEISIDASNSSWAKKETSKNREIAFREQT